MESAEKGEISRKQKRGNDSASRNFFSPEEKGLPSTAGGAAKNRGGDNSSYQGKSAPLQGIRRKGKTWRGVRESKKDCGVQ